MKNLIYSNGLYAICQLDKKNLYELAEFVVRENLSIMMVIFPLNLSGKKYMPFIKKSFSILIIQ